MSKAPSVQPPKQLLELIARPYRKRDEILEASNRLVDYSYSLQNCSKGELEGLQSKINKEVNRIMSCVNELAPFLENPQIVISLAQITMLLSTELERLGHNLAWKDFVGRCIRTCFCPLANMTRLKLTPKSFRKAYGIAIGIKDIMTLEWFVEHQQDNW